MKAQGIPVNMIILTALALLVLIVVGAFFVSGFERPFDTCWKICIEKGYNSASRDVFRNTCECFDDNVANKAILECAKRCESLADSVTRSFNVQLINDTCCCMERKEW
jgi:hypothetical protein